MELFSGGDPPVYSVPNRYDVIRYREAGLSPERVEQLTGVLPRSQRRILTEEIAFGMSDQELHQQRQVGRPSVLSEDLRRQVDGLLSEDPAMKVVEVLRRLTTDHSYTSGKNPVYDYVKGARPVKHALPVVRFEGVAGEFCQHDFGKLRVIYTDGLEDWLIFYAARLKYSRMMHVCLVGGETHEVLIRGMESAAQAFGGLALFNVIDNTKAGVLKRQRDPQTKKEHITYQQQFHAFIQEANLICEPAYPYAGNQKGAVENLIGFTKGSFLQARRFLDRRDLERQRVEWLYTVNEERPCQATGILPITRLAEERQLLKPIDFGSDGYGLPYAAVVGTDARVAHSGYRYSTPHSWIGQSIRVRVHRTTVVLHYNGEAVTHPRIPANGRYSLLPEHRAALMVKPRGAIMAKRQILMDLCPEGERFFTELVHRRPLTWRDTDLPVAWELFERQGETAVREAFAFCLACGTIGGEYLRAWAEGMAR
jgi:transposase